MVQELDLVLIHKFEISHGFKNTCKKSKNTQPLNPLILKFVWPTLWVMKKNAEKNAIDLKYFVFTDKASNPFF
jgi:hypothetical protein